MRRFRRKPRVVWLRPSGTLVFNGVNPGDQQGAIVFEGPVNLGNGHQPTIEIPVVIDNPVDETFVGAGFTTFQKTGLNQQTQWGYSIRRIVGSLHCCCINQEIQNPVGHGVAITAGLMVRRVESDTGQAIAPGIDVNTQTITNWTDPWIWRRNWVLSGGDFPATFTGSFGWAAFPVTNASYGDIRSGCHIDAKSRRRVGPEERLFLDVSLQRLPFIPDSAVDESWNVFIYADLRVLATLHTNAGNRRNASR